LLRRNDNLSFSNFTDRFVLNDVREQIRECLEHAEQCARKAAAQVDPKLKEDFLVLERRWRSLARSYEFTERRIDIKENLANEVSR
jgi:hypothetical protein